MKKVFTKLFTACMAIVLAACSFIGCSSGGIKRNENETTIYIRAYKGGYGTEYLSTLCKKFNEAYAAEGYKVELMTPNATLTEVAAVREMSGNTGWADIYSCNFSIGTIVNNRDFGTSVLSLEDEVYNKPAISFDKTEEATLIKDKLTAVYDDELTMADGKHYALYGNISVGGLLVNTKKLAGYGLEIPKTTNELIACFDAILFGNDANGNKSSALTNQKPITYIGSDNGYHTHFYNAWVAQYEGADWWEQFWAYEDAEGNARTADGEKLYEAAGLREAMEDLYRIYDPVYVAEGSQSNTLATAHTRLMEDAYGAVFMADGDWAYNEVIVDYKSKIGDLAFMNIPVISELGIKLFADDGYDAATCEAILSYTIGKTDAGKTAAEIVAEAASEKSWTLTEADVISVMKARGVFVDRTMGAGNFAICNKTQYADICYLFLRMVASNDAAKIMADEAHMLSAFTNDYSLMGESGYWKSVGDILGNANRSGVWTLATGYRREKNAAGILPASGYLFANAVILEQVSAFTGNLKDGTLKKENESEYAKKAKERIDKDIAQAVKDFNTYRAG